MQWSEPLEAILAAQVYNRKAYIKTDLTGEIKWNLVRTDVSEHQLFKELSH